VTFFLDAFFFGLHFSIETASNLSTHQDSHSFKLHGLRYHENPLLHLRSSRYQNLRRKLDIAWSPAYHSWALFNLVTSGSPFLPLELPFSVPPPSNSPFSAPSLQPLASPPQPTTYVTSVLRRPSLLLSNQTKHITAGDLRVTKTLRTGADPKHPDANARCLHPNNPPNSSLNWILTHLPIQARSLKMKSISNKKLMK
jgi:hypothetical protein